MEKLFYSLQFDRRIKRHINLLKFLDKQDKIVSAETIARALKCTIPTLRNDISYLNSLPDNGFVIKEYFRSGYFLETQKFKSIESYIAKYAQETLPYKIIDDIFHNRILTMGQAERKYFVSSSVIRKAIKHMNKVLVTFDIEILFNKIDFKGEEINIRFFLFVFFQDFKNHFIFIDDIDIHKRVYEMVVTRIKAISHSQLNYSYSRAISWIMVNTVRIMHHNYIAINPEIKQLLKTRQSYMTFKVVFDSLVKDTLHLDVSVTDEIYWAYASSLHSISYTPLESDTKQTNPAYHYESDLQTAQMVESIVDEAVAEGIISRESFSHHFVQAYLTNMCLLKQITEHFLRVSKPLAKFISEGNVQSVKKWTKILTNHPKIRLKYPQDVAVTLTMLGYNNQPMYQRKKYILLSFHGELGYDHFLYQICRQLIDKDTDILYLENHLVDEKYLQQKKIDLVICNYDLTIKNTDTTIFRLSYIPTATEWLLLRELIFKPL